MANSQSSFEKKNKTMTSYHDLEKQVYEDIRAEPYTRIPGRPSWRAKEGLAKEARNHALRHRVSYDWAGQYGLLAEIIGAARYAADNPLLPAYVAPVQPANSPVMPAAPTAAQIRQLTDDNNLLKRDWAVVCGFRRGVGANMRDALDLEFYSALEHATYGYLNVTPREYIVNLETNHCPLDVTAIEELKDHYYRGKQPDERLSKFATRLDVEQARLAIDGIVIPNDDKFQHYLSEIYKSGIFTLEAITQWTERAPDEQTYANARTFFEGKQRGMETVQRITGGSTGGAGYGVAAAAREIKALKDTIKEAIEETVAQALEEKINGREQGEGQEHAMAMRQLRDDNAVHKKEIEELSRAITELTKQIRELKELKGDEDGDKENQSPKKRARANETFEWKAGMKFNHKWPPKKKKEFNKQFKEKDPEGYKKEQLDRLERQRKAISGE